MRAINDRPYMHHRKNSRSPSAWERKFMKEFLDNLVNDAAVAEAILQEHQRSVTDYEQRIRTMGIDSAVRQAVTAAGGRNLTAIRALMDEAALDAQDAETAARQAVAKIKRENPYLFADAQVTAPGTGMGSPAGDYTMDELGKLSLAEYRRYRKG